MADKRIYQLDEEITVTDGMTLIIDDASFTESKSVKVSTLVNAIVAAGGYVPYEGAIETVDLGEQDLETTGYVTQKKLGTFATLTSEADTTITTAIRYYPINGSFTNSPSEGFTPVATPGLRYDATKTLYFKVSWACSFECDVAGTTVVVGIALNENSVTESLIRTYCKYAGESVNSSGIVVLELSTNDEVQLIVTSDSSRSIVSFNNFNVAITQFFN